jgi:hypothetical protein
MFHLTYVGLFHLTYMCLFHVHMFHLTYVGLFHLTYMCLFHATSVWLKQQKTIYLLKLSQARFRFINCIFCFYLFKETGAGDGRSKL